MQNKQLGACLAFSALVALTSIAQVHADATCQGFEDPWQQYTFFKEQVHKVVSEMEQSEPSPCAALDAADKVYRVSTGSLMDGYSISRPNVLTNPIEQLDCDWFRNASIPGAKQLRKNRQYVENRAFSPDPGKLCEQYPAPQGYQISQAYSGISGLQH